MPFLRPFRNKFIPGDLIYGLRGQRKRYIDLVSAFIDARGLNDDAWPPIYIDDYVVPPEKKCMEDVIKRNKGNVDYCKGRLNYIEIHHNEYQEYSKDFFENLRQNKKYSSVVNEKERFNELNLGRKCKGGLLWVGNDSKLVKDIHVHFILDDINMQWVADKHEEFEKKSITGQELRWIFRNRHNAKVKQKVQFWQDGQPVCPPWESEESHIWDNYERKLMEKGGAGEEERYDGLSRLFKILCCGV
ncbi:hypothetical protein ID858_11200 [Xenorhabdus sp. DI]|uniref:hypothetical protein n=1 Tax=Xenorhabdus doucetiae TaxID=351671 RepID=UPI0019BFCE30|nr:MULTISPECIES: hypothetical protein [unclassified Xenorhabdus]MBD2783449.1 hypothetical protein [Xenorhabdus sp. 3]MBD2789072.1 hypothetical protein [Xenorhabdus sp. DI]